MQWGGGQSVQKEVPPDRSTLDRFDRVDRPMGWPFWTPFIWPFFGSLLDPKSLQMPWFWVLGPPLFLGRFGPPEGTSPLRRYYPIFDKKVIQKWLTFWKKWKWMLERERHFFSLQKRKCDNKRIYQQNALWSPRARGNVFWPFFDQNPWFLDPILTKMQGKIGQMGVPNRGLKTTKIGHFETP